VREPRPGIFEVQLRVRDPLRDPIVLSEPVITESGFDLPVGVDELGEGVYLQCRNQSGVVVGGLPGSGKSAWVSFAVSSLAQRSDVQWLLIDGKGGHDVEALAPRAYRYLSADEACDLECVRDALGSVHTLMRERLKNSVWLYGRANLWSAGPSSRHPVVFVVIDECQSYLDPRSFATKGDKGLAA
jgi:hypothetical protein